MKISDELAWDAVERRDRAYDGRFVFAVTSTGIFCRPSCPARRPRRDNVRFFGAIDDAERAGFRACRRCRPDGNETPLAERVRAVLDAQTDEGITLAELARRVGVSAHHLQRVFKRELGVSPKEYLAARRNERFKAGLKEGMSVIDATWEAGYGSTSRLYEQSNARLGMTPSAYRAGGEGMSIRYTTVDTTLGRMLVAVTDRGVCAVSLGENDEALEESLRAEYPRAELENAADQQLTNAVRAIVDQIEERVPSIDLPLDVRATGFQISVWNELRRIPYGETRTYSEIAAAVGKPAAVRAVASACARNRVALVVPCHRVVRSDGEAGGYRWGMARKQRILDREGAGKTRD